MRKHRLFLAAALLLAVFSSVASATTYEVGDGKTYTSIGAVPWESLNAGDTVLIYYRSTAYKEKFVLGRVGTSSQPITVRGVAGAGGELPVIDGQSATTRQQLSTGSENRGIITMQQWTTVPTSCHPSYIVIENLEIKNASVPYTFTDDSGATVSYVDSSAAIWITDCRNVIIRNCYIHDCGNGVFTYTEGSGADCWTEDVLVEGNYITNCGNSGRVYEHSSYTESYDIAFQYNRYGPPRGGDTSSIGNSIKDRSAGLVVRYNWIEGGNRTMDIVDPEDSSTLGNDALYEKTFMYGNVLIERNDAGNRQVVHFGGDMAGVYRPKGYFYNNTVVSYRSGYTTLVMENGGSSSVFDCRNNVLYVTGSGSDLEISNDSDGVVNLRNNWMKTGYRLSGSGGGTVNDYYTVTGSDPGFVNLSTQDFHLASGSGCINAGTTLHSDCSSYPVTQQYVKHQDYETRPSDSTLDIGAFEYGSSTPPDLVITTSSLPGGTVSTAYSQTVSATGGTTPYSWSVVSGSLPSGLSIGSSTGTISGTPTASGTSNFTVRVTDSQGTPDTDDQALSITIASGIADLVITTSSLPGGTQGTAYSQTVQATGGTTPYSWSVVSGSLPSGLSLGSSTGTISGTPTASGTSNFTVRVADSQGTPDTDDQALSIAITSGGTQQVTFQDGLSSYTGTRDNWLDSDTPTTNYGTVVQAHLQYGTQDRQIHSFDVSSIPSNATINSATISFYVYNVTGGTPNVNCYRILTQWDELQSSYNNRLTGTAWGTPGLLSGTDYAATAIASSGNITGAMWANFTITSTVQAWVNGSQNNYGVMYRLSSAGHLYTRMSEYTVDTSQRPKLVVNYTSGGVPDLVITTSSLPGGTQGVAYSQTVQATGGTTPYSWSVVSGSLPSGLSIGSSTGTISGTPSSYGTSNFTVRVTDSQGTPDTDDQALSIAVSPANLVITTSSLPNGTVSTAYSQTVQATGGATPYSWSVVSGSLPAGLSLGSSSGTISGTPTASGTSNFTVRVTDSQGTPDTDDQALSIIVTGGGSNSTYEFTASDTESTTTSTSYQNKASLVFTPSTSDTWMIFGFAEYKGSSTSYSTLVRLTVDGTTEGDLIVEPNDATDYQTFMTMKVASLSAAQHTINIDYRSENAAATARVRNVRIVAIPKAALEMVSNASDGTSTLTTTLTDYVTLNWTPATAGDYLLIWSGEARSNTGYSTQVQAKINGANWDEMFIESKDNTDFYSFMSFAMTECGTSQQTLAVAAAKESTSTATTHQIRRARVAAIRLTGSRFAAYRGFSSDAEATTTSTSFQEKLSDSWSPSPTGNWLFLTSCRVAGTSASYSNESRVQLDDSTTLAQPLREPNDTTDYMQAGCIDVRSLATGTRKLDIDYRSENSGATAKIRTARLYALPLD